MEEKTAKVYVDVWVKCDKDGNIMPLAFSWENGERYSVKKIIEISRRASLKAGGIGMRYTVELDGGHQTYLYHEDIDASKFTWFMERK